ncbi:MAG: glycerol acyltransferase [Crocinitomicaceae bacterium]|jgi:1-acyl-sn-glycerol-3-phosphate acyltransferase|nr:glycerol acyltransferase [Crocinitomicaceae bacterium]
MENKKFIDIRRLIGSKNPRLLKWLPGFILRYLERILHQDEINAFLEAHPNEKNQEFCTAVIDYFNIKIELTGLENIPKTGGATLAMNHPLGGMDAMALVSALRDYRRDIKYIVNDLLLQIEPLKELFEGVNKHGKNTEGTYQKIDELFASGQLVCIFPSGLVSRKINGQVRDLEWKKTFVTLSKKSDIPIIPIYIDGKLSNFFYRLANFRTFLGIKANIEMLYLSNEMFKQRNRTIRFVIGKPIMPEEIDESKNHREWAMEIRNRLYQLENK